MSGDFAVLIPVVGIMFGIGIAAVAIITKHRQDLQRNELRHKERLAAIEKGIELPPELAVENGNGNGGGGESRRGNTLRTGLTTLFVGVVLYFALLKLVGDEIALFGLIPAAVGVANLIFYFVEGRKQK